MTLYDILRPDKLVASVTCSPGVIHRWYLTKRGRLYCKVHSYKSLQAEQLLQSAGMIKTMCGCCRFLRAWGFISKISLTTKANTVTKIFLSDLAEIHIFRPDLQKFQAQCASKRHLTNPTGRRSPFASQYPNESLCHTTGHKVEAALGQYNFPAYFYPADKRNKAIAWYFWIYKKGLTHFEGYVLHSLPSVPKLTDTVIQVYADKISTSPHQLHFRYLLTVDVTTRSLISVEEDPYGTRT